MLRQPALAGRSSTKPWKLTLRRDALCADVYAARLAPTIRACTPSPSPPPPVPRPSATRPSCRKHPGPAPAMLRPLARQPGGDVQGARPRRAVAADASRLRRPARPARGRHRRRRAHRRGARGLLARGAPRARRSNPLHTRRAARGGWCGPRRVTARTPEPRRHRVTPRGRRRSPPPPASSHPRPTRAARRCCRGPARTPTRCAARGGCSARASSTTTRSGTQLADNAGCSA